MAREVIEVTGLITVDSLVTIGKEIAWKKNSLIL